MWKSLLAVGVLLALASGRVEAQPAFAWTGFYVGGHAGYGWSEAENLDPKGWFGGGQIGYNWQYAPNWVFVLEADISGGDISAGGGVVPS